MSYESSVSNRHMSCLIGSYMRKAIASGKKAQHPRDDILKTAEDTKLANVTAHNIV